MDTRHMPGVHAGSFFIPGGNGLPDLEVLTSDPAGWVSMQIAARQKPTETASGSGVDPQGNIKSDGTTDAATSFTSWASGAGLKDTLTGLVVAFGATLLAVLLVVLGAYYLIKD